MKRFLKVTLVLVFIVAVVLMAFSGYVATYGRQILLAEVEKNLGVKANASSVRYVFPASLAVQALDIGGQLKVDRVLVSPNLLSIIKGDLILHALVLDKPHFKITRNSDDTFSFGLPVGQKTAEEAPSQGGADIPKKDVTAVQRFYLNTLKVRGGTVEFTDQGVSAAEPLRIFFSALDLDVTHPNLFNFFLVQFQGHSDIMTPHDEPVGSMDLSGWADISAKDMDAKLVLSKIQLACLGPYYKEFLKRELTSGEMALEALLKSNNNDLKADCHVELNRIAFKDIEGELGTEGASEPIDVTVLAFNSILNAQGKVVFDFSVQTKMDRPRFEKIKMKGVFLSSKAEDLLAQASGADVEDFKKIGDQFESIGKEFKKIFQEKK